MKLILASPVEPSGASWLINCFLELGVKVSHKPVVDNVWRHSDPPPPPDYIWQPLANGRHRLRPKAHVLKQFLPVLSRVDDFRFRDDAQVEYLQELPLREHVADFTLLFVRDPRDSLYSMYRRVGPAVDYEGFLRFPDPDTLLDRPTHWRLFVEAWMARAGHRWFTFEDCKRDPAGLLRRVLEEFRIARSASEIDRAVRESSFDKARAAEAGYRAGRAGDWELVNRAGRVGEWIDREEARRGRTLIERRAVSLMRRLGYTGLACDRDEKSTIDDAFAFSCQLDEAILQRSGLPAHRIRRLLDSLASAALANGWESAERINALRTRFTEGSDHQFAQVRDLLRVRKQGGRPDA